MVSESQEICFTMMGGNLVTVKTEEAFQEQKVMLIIAVFISLFVSIICFSNEDKSRHSITEMGI